LWEARKVAVNMKDQGISWGVIEKTEQNKDVEASLIPIIV